MKLLLEIPNTSKNILKIILDSHVVERNNTERSYEPFTQFPPMVTFGKTRISKNYHN